MTKSTLCTSALVLFLTGYAQQVPRLARYEMSPPSDQAVDVVLVCPDAPCDMAEDYRVTVLIRNNLLPCDRLEMSPVFDIRPKGRPGKWLTTHNIYAHRVTAFLPPGRTLLLEYSLTSLKWISPITQDNDRRPLAEELTPGSYLLSFSPHFRTDYRLTPSSKWVSDVSSQQVLLEFKGGARRTTKWEPPPLPEGAKELIRSLEQGLRDALPSLEPSPTYRSFRTGIYVCYRTRVYKVQNTNKDGSPLRGKHDVTGPESQGFALSAHLSPGLYQHGELNSDVSVHSWRRHNAAHATLGNSMHLYVMLSYGKEADRAMLNAIKRVLRETTETHNKGLNSDGLAPAD
jgi:hypothetical protein